MARPREFKEDAVLEAATNCFWYRGYEATSIRDLIAATGLTGASLYNAFGDKRALFQIALDRYVEATVGERIQRCQGLPPADAVVAFFDEILERSITDPKHRGCLLVNSALEIAPHDTGLRRTVAGAFDRIESFFRDNITAGQADGTIASRQPAGCLAKHLLGVLMGVRVLARAKPERPLLESIVASAIQLLGRTDPVAETQTSPRPKYGRRAGKR